MGCLQSTSFIVLINGSPSNFFHSSRGLRKGCPLSPFIFVLVAEELSKPIHNAKENEMIKGIKVSSTEEFTHTLFVDDFLVFGEGTIINIEDFSSLIDKCKNSTAMVVNMENSNLIHNEFLVDMIQREREIMPFQITSFEVGFKYLGFFLNPNSYSYQD